MDKSEIHALFLKAAIQAAKRGATAKELHAYFKEAEQGMRVNAAFGLSGSDFVAALEREA